MQKTRLFLFAAIGALLTTLLAATAALATTTPITPGTTWTGATPVESGKEYSSSGTGSAKWGYFRIDPTPVRGQIVTVAFTTTATWAGGAHFYLYDQDHDISMREVAAGAERSYQWDYVGNNTTPTAYYFAVYNYSGTNDYLFTITLTDQSDGNLTGDAGDTSGTARLLTPAANSLTSYTGNTEGNADNQDWFRIPSASGQTISVTVSAEDWGTAAGLTLDLADETGHFIPGLYQTYNNTVSEFEPMTWVSNNTSPAAYLLKVYSPNNTGNEPLVYKIDVQMGQQSDAGTAGDAGDDFDSARTVQLSAGSPKINWSGNMLSGSDLADYFLIKLPGGLPGESPLPYRFQLGVDDWPASAGHIDLAVYDSQQNPLPNMGTLTIARPSKDILDKSITACGQAGCYFKISSSYTVGNNPVHYTIKVQPPNFLFLPFLVR